MLHLAPSPFRPSSSQPSASSSTGRPDQQAALHNPEDSDDAESQDYPRDRFTFSPWQQELARQGLYKAIERHQERQALSRPQEQPKGWWNTLLSLLGLNTQK